VGFVRGLAARENCGAVASFIGRAASQRRQVVMTGNKKASTINDAISLGGMRSFSDPTFSKSFSAGALKVHQKSNDLKRTQFCRHIVGN
jgi:hypothetical protein